MKMYRAVVEDNKDPEYLGRVRVRIFGIHPETTAAEKSSFVATNTLPWAEVMGGTHFGLISGVGVSSILRQGTWVWVFLDDDDPNKPIVVGTIVGNNFKPDSTLGFKDPDGVYPKSTRLNTSDIHPFLNEQKYTSLATLETACGHLIELDDTAGDERIKVKHKTGTQFTVDALGNLIVDVVKDTSIHIIGDTNILVDGYTAVKSIQDMRLSSDANIMLKASTIQLNPSFGFPEPLLIDSPTTFARNIVPVIEVPDDHPANPEQIDIGDESSFAPVSTTTIPGHISPMDSAMKAYSLGSSAWKENGRNPNIIALWTELGMRGQTVGDTTAWCAIFVGACLKRSGNKYIKTASSQGYKNYGITVPLSNIQKGDIVLFYRDGASSGKGHIGFYTGVKTATTITVLGGNQGQTLKTSTYKISDPAKGWGITKIIRAVSATDGTTPAPLPETEAPPSTPDSGSVT